MALPDGLRWVVGNSKLQQSFRRLSLYHASYPNSTAALIGRFLLSSFHYFSITFLSRILIKYIYTYRFRKNSGSEKCFSFSYVRDLGLVTQAYILKLELLICGWELKIRKVRGARPQAEPRKKTRPKAEQRRVGTRSVQRLPLEHV